MLPGVFLLAETGPAETAAQTTAAVTATLNWLNGKIPFFPWVILLVIVAALAAYVWAKIRAVRIDEANAKRAQAAENALVVANAEGERLRLILQVVATALKRKDALDHGVARGQEPSTTDDGLRNLCEWIVKVLAIEKPDVNKMTVWAPTDDGKKLRIVEYHGMNPESARKLEFDVHPPHDDGDSFAARAFRNERVEICNDTQTDHRYVKIDGHEPTHPYRSIIAVPIRRGQHVVGVYTIDSREVGRFPESDTVARQQYELYGRLFALFVTPSQGMGITMRNGADKAKEGAANLEGSP